MILKTIIKFCKRTKAKLIRYQLNVKIIKIDKYYFRPTEVHELKGDASKARRELGWKPEISFKKLVKDMVEYDIKNSK